MPDEHEGNPSDLIQVNGALMQRAFFVANLAEARAEKWIERGVPVETDHLHCIVCWVALRAIGCGVVRRSGDRVICEHCFNTYLS